MTGHVSDSVADIEAATGGIGASLTDHKLLQKYIKKSLDTYISMFPNKVSSHFQKAYDIYLENPLRVPTLYIHSNGDRVSTPTTPLRSIAHQKQYNIPSFYHEFNTPHVQHFKYNPEKYVELLDDFLNFINLGAKI